MKVILHDWVHVSDNRMSEGMSRFMWCILYILFLFALYIYRTSMCERNEREKKIINIFCLMFCMQECELHSQFYIINDILHNILVDHIYSAVFFFMKMSIYVIKFSPLKCLWIHAPVEWWCNFNNKKSSLIFIVC